MTATLATALIAIPAVVSLYCSAPPAVWPGVQAGVQAGLFFLLVVIDAVFEGINIRLQEAVGSEVVVKFTEEDVA
jgi:hypothetical protein